MTNCSYINKRTQRLHAPENDLLYTGQKTKRRAHAELLVWTWLTKYINSIYFITDLLQIYSRSTFTLSSSSYLSSTPPHTHTQNCCVRYPQSVALFAEKNVFQPHQLSSTLKSCLPLSGTRTSSLSHMQTHTRQRFFELGCWISSHNWIHSSCLISVHLSAFCLFNIVNHCTYEGKMSHQCNYSAQHTPENAQMMYSAHFHNIIQGISTYIYMQRMHK